MPTSKRLPSTSSAAARFYTFSCALIAVVLVFCAVFGVKMDVEFKGGSMITLAYEGRR